MTTTKTRLSPVDFYELEVLPAAFDSLDRVFPELALKRTGNGWTATSREATKPPPFNARPDRVVCNKPGGFLVHGGEPVSWLEYLTGRKPTGADFVQAVKDLADRAGVDASVLERDETPEQREQRTKRERRGTLLETFLDQARTALLGNAGGDARTYLVADRGFQEDELAALPFGLFTTPETVRAELLAADYSADELEASGLLADARWTGRLVLPLRDHRGNVATVAARSLDQAEPKYLYLKGGTKPPASGLDVALRDRPEELVLVEGLVDPVSLQARGLPNVAALGGRLDLLNVDRWNALLALGVRRFVLASDADQAGREGLLKALENARKVGNVPNVYVVDPADLGDAKDPDELVRRHGLDAFLEALEKRKPGAVYEAEARLAGVTPDAPDHRRREAVELVLELDAGLRGDRASLDREDILRAAAAATGYDVETLAELAEDYATKRRRERTELELDSVFRDAARDRHEGRDAFEVARETIARLAKVQALSVEPPPAFSVERLEAESRETPEGKPSGWAAVDAEAVRFNAGELALLAARTGHGKTSALVGLLVNWLDNVDNGNVSDEVFLLYSHEEPEVRVFHRLLSALSVAAGDGWTTGEVQAHLRRASENPYHPEGYWPNPEKLKAARERLRNLEGRLLVVHRPSWSVDDLAAHARDVAEDRNVGAVLVDYLQRVPPTEGRKYDRRDQEVSAVGRGLKALAVDLACPVVAGAQINREAVPPKLRDEVQKAGSYHEALPKIRAARPDLHHLREGGSEQEADLVLGLLNYAADYRTEAGGERLPDVTLLEVGTLKNRYGAVGRWASLGFVGRFGLVRDASDEELAS